MIWKDVEKKYGKEIADEMKQSSYLQGITITMTENGETDIPESDIRLAYKDIKGKRISPFEWD